MKDDSVTESERQFKRYCVLRGYPFERISSNGSKTPDFRIQSPVGPVICEVKELQANKEDKKYIREIRNQGSSLWGHTSKKVGKRVNSLIHSGAKQLGSYRENPAPSLLVVYDNIQVDGFRLGWNSLNPLDIESGMFGEAAIRFYTSNKKDSIFKGDRQMTEKSRNYISAIALLAKVEERKGLCLDIYHNPFAVKPLLPRYFPNDCDEHWCKAGHPDQVGWGWDRFVGDKA